MKTKLYFAVLWIFIITFSSTTAAVEQLPDNLIKFSDNSSLGLLQQNANVNLLKLLSQFTTQNTTTYCGVASAVMVLNSVDLPPPADLEHKPYNYFTQNNFFNRQVTNIISPTTVLKTGMTLMQLSKALASYGLKTDTVFADTLDLGKFRNKLTHAIAAQNYIIVNFLRTGLKQQGGGHHSPIAAYDKNTDRFLVLDVARYKYPAYWVKTADLWAAVNTVDEHTSRGFIIINK